jgi:hypothetical protein
MTGNERELIDIIRGHDDPERAVKIALDLMVDFLAKLEALQDTSSVRPLESA